MCSNQKTKSQSAFFKQTWGLSREQPVAESVNHIWSRDRTKALQGPASLPEPPERWWCSWKKRKNNSSITSPTVKTCQKEVFFWEKKLLVPFILQRNQWQYWQTPILLLLLWNRIQPVFHFKIFRGLCIVQIPMFILAKGWTKHGCFRANVFPHVHLDQSHTWDRGRPSRWFPEVKMGLAEVCLSTLYILKVYWMWWPVSFLLTLSHLFQLLLPAGSFARTFRKPAKWKYHETTCKLIGSVHQTWQENLYSTLTRVGGNMHVLCQIDVVYWCPLYTIVYGFNAQCSEPPDISETHWSPQTINPQLEKKNKKNTAPKHDMRLMIVEGASQTLKKCFRGQKLAQMMSFVWLRIIVTHKQDGPGESANLLGDFVPSPSQWQNGKWQAKAWWLWMERSDC